LGECINPSQDYQIDRASFGHLESAHLTNFLPLVRDSIFVSISVPPNLKILTDRSAWIGWFPVLFYTTVYVGDIYRSGLPDSVDPGSEEVDAEATRLGTRALFWSACISLFFNFTLPFLVPRTVKRRMIGDIFQEEGGALKRIARKFQISLPMLWALSHALFALCMFSTL
jgi:solute carrier family 45 protein 1/2/4